MNNTNYILTVHDELISNLLLMNCNNIVYNNDTYPTNVATIHAKRVDISILSSKKKELDKFILDRQRRCCHTYIVSNCDDYVLKNSYSLTSQEIIIYLILLHHYIITNNEYAVITIKEINKYRHRKSINDSVFDAYVKALLGLKNKSVYYNIKHKYVGKTIMRNFQNNQQLVYIKSIVDLGTDYQITYSLGPLGQIIRDGKNYSCIAPKDTYSVSFGGINYLLVMMYLTRLIYINRRKNNKNATIKIALTTIMENINKYNKQGYNTNLTYYDIISADIEDSKMLEWSSYHNELIADDYALFDSKKQAYFERLYNSEKKRACEKINKNRDLRHITRNIQLALDNLKQSHQIKKYYFHIPELKDNIDLRNESLGSWNKLDCRRCMDTVVEIVLIQNDI